LLSVNYGPSAVHLFTYYLPNTSRMIPLGEDGYCTHFTGEEYAIILSGPGTWAMAKQDSHARARKCAANLLSCHASSKVQIPWWSTWVHKIVTHPGKCVSHGTIYPSTSDAHCLAPLCGCGYLLHREEEITAVSGNPCAAKGKNKPVSKSPALSYTPPSAPNTASSSRLPSTAPCIPCCRFLV
jgi:hypothetical protein